MPYYLEKDDRELLKKLLRQNTCSECGSELESFYDIEKHLPFLQCKSHPEHNGIAKQYGPPLTLDEMNMNTRREYMAEQIKGKASTTALEKIPTQGQLTQSQAMHILQLVYPDAPEDEIIRCAILCRDFGLHPLMKEVYLIPFKDKSGKANYATVLGINATRKMMARHGTFSYIDNTPRVMTEKEQTDIFGEVQTDRIVAITKLRTKGGLEAQGYGHYMLKDNPYGTDKGNTKANMAFIRSERQAFSRLFPDSIPPEVEIIDEAYVEVPQIGKVDATTGEIVEGETKEIGEEPIAADESVEEQGTEPTNRDETPITAEQVKGIMTLLKKNEMSVGDLGKWMVKAERVWKVRLMTDLKVWQYEEICKAFEKGEQLGLK